MKRIGNLARRFEAFLKAGSSIIATVSAVGSLAAVFAVFLALYQLKDARRSQDAAAYAMISASWHDHLAVFLDQPKLRPYFFDRKRLASDADEEIRSKVETMADIRLDAMDRVLIAADLSGWELSEVEPWKLIFERAFEDGPQLCLTLRDVPGDYDRLAEIAERGCEVR